MSEKCNAWDCEYNHDGLCEHFDDICLPEILKAINEEENDDD